jgi:adenine phosphoribosyltransferase
MTKDPDLRALVRDIPDFPEPGVLFRDITPLLSDARAFSLVLDRWLIHCFALTDAIVGMIARLPFGTPLATS